jgi:hypothetical protein
MPLVAAVGRRFEYKHERRVRRGVNKRSKLTPPWLSDQYVVVPIGVGTPRQSQTDHIGGGMRVAKRGPH